MMNPYNQPLHNQLQHLPQLNLETNFKETETIFSDDTWKERRRLRKERRRRRIRRAIQSLIGANHGD